MSFSDWLTFAPLLFNGLLAVTNAFENNWGKCLYWTGAFILTIGIFKMEG